MRSYEVIVVGCGPAGNTVAYQLAQQGKKVLLLEKERLPRRKVCGGGLSRKTLMELPYSVEPVIERKMTGAFLAHGRDVFRVPLPEAGAMVTRETFDSFMCRKAVESGARLEEECAFLEFRHSAGHLLVHTTRGSFTTKVLVGADGAYSKVRRQLYPSRQVRLVPAMEARVYPQDEPPAGLEREAWFDLGALQGGYGWIFPKRDHFNVGLYRFRKSRHGVPMKTRLEEFVLTHSMLRNHREVSCEAHCIPVRPVAGELTKDNVVLVGDAAGVAEGFYGEGIYHAIKSAKIAAECILATLNGESRLSTYNREMISTRFQLKVSRVMAGLFYPLPGWVSQGMLRNMMVNGFFTKLLTGGLSPLGCFLCTVGLLPFWIFSSRFPTVPVEAALNTSS